MRTLQGRFLLRPSTRLNQIIAGCLGRAQKRHGMAIHGCVFLSNHFHLLLSPSDAHQLARFMNHFASKLAREVARLYGWREHVWGRRYQAIPVSDEEPAQVGRLRYLLAHGCKESLVERPEDWPGVNCARALATGETLCGVWQDRSAEAVARHEGREIDPSRFAVAEEVRLSALPCWAPLSPAEYRQRVQQLLEEITHHYAAERARQGIRCLGARWVLRQHPHSRPKILPRRHAPRIHAFTSEARRAFQEAYRAFVHTFRLAARRLRAGDLAVRFPPWSFPPPLPLPTG
ncbi:MAG TPA: transposase [Thermoanaerobaculia bacterium]|nr:transposase [Thermoanaerobaculia bacterium]